MSNDAGEKFFAGLIVGAVLGLAIGMLTAPRSGKETREIIKERMDEFNKNVKEKFSEYGKRLKQSTDTDD